MISMHHIHQVGKKIVYEKEEPSSTNIDFDALREKFRTIDDTSSQPSAPAESMTALRRAQSVGANHSSIGLPSREFPSDMLAADSFMHGHSETAQGNSNNDNAPSSGNIVSPQYECIAPPPKMMTPKRSILKKPKPEAETIAPEPAATAEPAFP